MPTRGILIAFARDVSIEAISCGWCSILKFGVEVGNDVKRIQKMYNCPISGCVDLRNLAVRSGMNM